MDDLWNDAVKKAIEEKGLTVKELAEKLDKSEAEVENLISKEGRATIEELYGIARTIPEAKRPYFLRALLYLAQCFREL